MVMVAAPTFIVSKTLRTHIGKVRIRLVKTSSRSEAADAEESSARRPVLAVEEAMDDVVAMRTCLALDASPL